MRNWPRPGGGSEGAQRLPAAHGGEGDDVAFPRRADGPGGRPGPVPLAVYRHGEPPQVLGEFDTFDGGDVLPGFTAQVWSFFRRRE